VGFARYSLLLTPYSSLLFITTKHTKPSTKHTKSLNIPHQHIITLTNQQINKLPHYHIITLTNHQINK